MKSSHITIGKKIIKISFELVQFFVKTRLKCKSCAHKQLEKQVEKVLQKIIKKILKEYYKLHVGHIYLKSEKFRKKKIES